MDTRIQDTPMVMGTHRYTDKRKRQTEQQQTNEKRTGGFYTLICYYV